MAALVFATCILVFSGAVVGYIVLADLIERRRKRLASWTERTLVGLHSSEVQIQLVYLSRRGHEYVMKRQVVGSVYAADAEHDEVVAKLMTKARARAFEMNMGGS